MKLRTDLAFFSTLVKCGSLSAAAQEFNVTPSAVSKWLAQLEERLGVRLRGRHGLAEAELGREGRCRQQGAQAHGGNLGKHDAGVGRMAIAAETNNQPLLILLDDADAERQRRNGD